MLWGKMDKPVGLQYCPQGAGPGVQGAAGQTGWRSKCCFGLALEQRSPPEGPLAQSWGNQAPTIHPSGLAPAPVPRLSSCPGGSHGPGRGSSRAAVPICFSLGQHLGLPESTPGFSSFGEEAWICWGEGGKLMQAAAHLLQALGGGRRAAPHLAASPQHVAITATMKLQCLLKSKFPIRRQ